MEQYNINKERYEWMKKNIYKRHPKWKKRAWVRYLLYGFNILVIGMAINLAYQHPGFLDIYRQPNEITRAYTLTDYLASGIFYILAFNIFPTAVALSYRALLYNTCRGSVGSHRNNVLILTETSLCDIYHIAGRDVQTMNETQFPYGELKRIVWNEYNQRFELYGATIDTDYLDFEKDKVESKRKSKSNLTTPYHLYWIFDDRDKFMESIEAKTKLKIEMVNYQSE